MKDEHKTREQLIAELQELRQRIETLERELMIRVESSPGPGTPPPAGDEAARPGPYGTETVLVVEDDDQVRDSVQRMLRMYGYKSIGSHSAETAIQIIRTSREPIHLILTDIMMPGMSGNELVGLMKPLKTGIRVIYMSGYSDSSIVPNDVFDVLDSGAAFIEKPFSAEKLAQKIRDELDAES